MIDAKKLAADVARRVYGREPERITVISRLNALVMRLRFADGVEKIAKFAKTSDASGLQKESEVHALIARHGIPAATVEHADFSAAPPWILMTSAGSRTVLDDLRPELVREMGRLLARVHGVPLDAASAVPRTPPADKPRLEQLARAMETARLIAPGAAAAFCALPMPEPSGGSLCHGDFHAVHCVINTDKITAIVDWGAAWRGNPLIDLAVAQAYLEYYAPQVAAELVEGYREVRDVPRDFALTYLPVRMAHALGLMHVFSLQQREPNVRRAAALFDEYVRARA